MPNPNDPLAQRAQDCADKCRTLIETTGGYSIEPLILDALRDAVEMFAKTANEAAEMFHRERNEARTALAAVEEKFVSFRQRLRDALYDFWPSNPGSDNDEIVGATRRLMSALAAAEKERDNWKRQAKDVTIAVPSLPESAIVRSLRESRNSYRSQNDRFRAALAAESKRHEITLRERDKAWEAEKSKDALIFGLQKSLATQHEVDVGLRTALAAAEKEQNRLHREICTAVLYCRSGRGLSTPEKGYKHANGEWNPGWATTSACDAIRELAAAQRERDDVLEETAKELVEAATYGNDLGTGHAMTNDEAVFIHNEIVPWLRALKSKPAPETTEARDG